VKKKRINLLLLILLIFSSCASSKKNIRSGWVNDEIYRIIGTGYIGVNKGNYEYEKSITCNAAHLDAELKAIKLLRGTEKTNKNRENKVVNIKIIGIVRRGEFIEKQFYKKIGKCEVIFEIRGKNLRKRYPIENN